MKKTACLLALLLSWVWGCAPAQQPTLNLFFTSDIEGVFWPRPEPRYGNEVIGGLSVLKSFLDKQTLPFILLEGGNWYAQTPEGTLTKGEYFNETASSLPYSARLFTEKDLLYGWGALSHIIKDSPAPFVSANVTLSNGKLPAGMRGWLLEETAGIKVGILGLVSRQAMKGKQRLGGLKINDEIESAQKAVQLLREKGAQVVVLISALGVPDDKEAVTDSRLAEEVPGIDVIVSANLGRQEAESVRVGKTWIVYPGSKLDSVGQMRLFFNKNKELSKAEFEDVVLYRRDFGEDSHVADLIANLRRSTRGQMNRSVGKMEQALKGKLNAESSLGNFAADCLRKWAKTDAAIINSDSLREDLPAGEITQYDLYRLYPYADKVTYLTMRGDSLLNALEAGLEEKDHFPQISGLKVRYNPHASVGKKILAVSVNGVPLAPKATYKVAVTDYMLAGGAGHDGFIDSLEFKNTQVEMRTILRLCLSGKNAQTKPELNRWRKAI